MRHMHDYAPTKTSNFPFKKETNILIYPSLFIFIVITKKEEKWNGTQGDRAS